MTMNAYSPTQQQVDRAQGAAGLTGLVGGLGSLFGGGGNPANAAMPYLNQIQGVAQGAFNPYIRAGQAQLGGLGKEYGALTGNRSMLQNQYGTLINDPSKLYNKFGAGYQQSPGFQFNVDQATKAANQAAAAGGMVGSPAEQQELARTISGLASQDYGSYMDRIMGLYGTGLQGAQGLYNTGIQGRQGLANMGLSAGGSLADTLSQSLATQGQAAYEGQNAQNQQRGGAFGGIGAGLGYLAGGPIGGAIGNYIFGS